jgi:ribonuclease HI
VDDSLASGKSGVGVVLRGPNQEKFDYTIKFEFATTNNEAEYEAVLSALMMA